MALGAAMLFNGPVFEETAARFAANPAFVFLAGLLALIAGLAIVRSHNLWVDDWRVIITILGWHAIIGGIVNIVFPNVVSAIRGGMGHSRLLRSIGGVVALSLGSFIAAKGWLS
jgi:hypothetical protein